MITLAAKTGITGPISHNDCLILHAALESMVHDCHAVQDNLTDAQWHRAEALLQEMDDYLNTTRKLEQKGEKNDKYSSVGETT